MRDRGSSRGYEVRGGGNRAMEKREHHLAEEERLI